MKDSLDSYRRDHDNENQRHLVAVRMLEKRLHELQKTCSHPGDQVKEFAEMPYCGVCEKLL